MKAWCGCIAAMMALTLGTGGCRESAEDWNEKAYRAFVAGNREEAIRCSTQALALEQDNVLALYSLGYVYKLEGRTDDAIAMFKKVIALNPNPAGFYVNLGDLYCRKGMYDEAIAACGQAITRQPEKAPAYYTMGIAFQGKGDLAAAAEYLFDAGLYAIVESEKTIATDAYNALKAIGNEQLALELQGVLGPWFDPAQDVVPEPG